MSCARCGQELPEVAQFCLKCGAAAVPPAVPIAEAASQITLPVKPYRWGKFQGWALVTLNPAAALITLASAQTEDERQVGIGLAVMCALSVPMGVGILKKKRFGLILVYVTLALICFSIVMSFATHGLEGAHGAAVGAGGWVLSTIYYHNRRNEFR
jgi:hypothetical protein